MTQTDDDTTRRLVEASAWRAHLAEVGEETSAAFEAWLLSDVRNLEAWQRVEGPWAFLGEHAAAPEVLAARSAALGLTRVGRRPSTSAIPWRGVAAMSLLLLLAIGAGIFWWEQAADYQTTFGERRVLTLSDGSRLSLDSNSEVKVSYSSRGRLLELLRGQARFEVAHDAARPFWVSAAGAVVKATGTDFDVDLPSQGVVVTLVQGRVAVSSESRTLALKEGDQLTIAPDRSLAVAAVNTSEVLAWQSGQVVFHNAPLAAAIARLNRYDVAQFVLADPSLATLRVSGTFNTGNAMTVAEILTGYLGLRAIYSDSGKIELRR
jgi:transmembrane sensor